MGFFLRCSRPARSYKRVAKSAGREALESFLRGEELQLLFHGD